MIVEFSQLGFIGKLFKSDELSLFINFFLMFANDKPVDWLYDIALNVKTCNPEKGAVRDQIFSITLLITLLTNYILIGPL